MQIFISHATADDPIATRIHDRLEAEGFAAWVDHHDLIPPISDNRETLDQAVKSSDVGLLVLSHHSAGRAEVDAEWSFILATQRPLFIAKVDDIAIADMNYRLGIVQWVDLSTDWDTGMTALVRAMRGEKPLPTIAQNSTTPLLKIASQTKTQERNRAKMLQKVRMFWVEGVLEKSLYAEARLELGMETKPEAVENPWDTVLQHVDYGNYKLPPDTRINDVFKAMSGELLILGEPGSGKTTTLLELAQELIARAEGDEYEPMPVVFNLSSWEKGKTLGEWLENELNSKYQVPKKVAKEWVAGDQLTLLLDGLDEVKPEYRNDCVEAINAFRSENGLDVAVCSRIRDYETLTKKLKLQKAIVLQPLTAEQANGYLMRLGADVEGVRLAYLANVTLQELLNTPLMLSIALLAYRGRDMRDFIVDKQVQQSELTKHLFEIYVNRMFERRGKEEQYTRERTIHWLAWIGRKMIGHPQGIFYVQGIQPNWLETQKHRQRYFRYFTAAASVTGGLVAGLEFAITLGLLSTVYRISPLEGILVLAPILILLTIPIILASELVYGFFGNVIFGISFGIAFSIIFQMFYNDLIDVLLLGLGAGFVFGWIRRASIDVFDIRVAASRNLLLLGRRALFLGIIFGLIAGLGGEAVVGLPYGVILGTIVGFSVLAFSSLSVQQHIILRLNLYLNDDNPWNYARFLDYCTERMFLRKVGEGYIFVHRLLMEYFAGLEG